MHEPGAVPTDAVEQALARPAPRGRLHRLGTKIMHEPALWLSAAYLATSALGLWASYWFYRPFGIPVFEYLQPSDILIAGLRDPVYLLLVLVGFAFYGINLWTSNLMFGNPERLARLRKNRLARVLLVPQWVERVEFSWWGAVVRMLLVPYMALVLIQGYVQHESRNLIRGEGTRVELIYAGDTQPQAEHPVLLGTTSSWVFVYWPDRHRSEAISQQALRGLVYVPRKSTAEQHGKP